MKFKLSLLALLIFSGCSTSNPETSETPVFQEEVEVLPAETKTIIDTFGFSFELPVTWRQKGSEDESRYLMQVGSPTTDESGNLLDMNYLDIHVWFDGDYSRVKEELTHDFLDAISEGYAEKGLYGEAGWTTERVIFAGKPTLIITYQKEKDGVTVERQFYHFIHNGYLFLIESSKTLEVDGEIVDPVGAQELDALMATFVTL